MHCIAFRAFAFQAEDIGDRLLHPRLAVYGCIHDNARQRLNQCQTGQNQEHGSEPACPAF